MVFRFSGDISFEGGRDPEHIVKFGDKTPSMITIIPKKYFNTSAVRNNGP